MVIHFDRHHLSAIGRIGKNPLVTDYAGVENDFAGCHACKERRSRLRVQALQPRQASP
jgi:hypothetical protein